MTLQDLIDALKARFGDSVSKMDTPDAWQIETPELRLLALLTDEQTQLRVLVPIVPMAEAQPFLKEILEANFEQTVHYASYENTLWGVFHHRLATLETEELLSAIDQLYTLKQTGIDPFFNTLIETRVRQIIQAAKLQGQSLQSTMQTISRFYAEGMMGDMENSGYGDRALEAWQRQLERLWPEVGVPPEESSEEA